MHLRLLRRLTTPCRARLQDQASLQDESKLPQLLEARTAFRHRVQQFRPVQAVYTPQIVVLLAQDPASRTDVVEIEQVRLGLPSEIQTQHRSTSCPPDILAIEACLRDAQCRDALRDIRTQLHVQDRLYKLKKLHVRHQGPNTRMQTDIKGQNSRVRRAAAKYRRARKAKLALVGPGPWEAEFRPLADNDIRGVQDDDADNVAERSRKQKRPGPAEGHRLVSWIWRSADTDGSTSYLDSVRVEWTKLRARVLRWMEEKRLLPEEMRRILAWMRHQESLWMSRVNQRLDVDDALQEGLTAYAHKQAGIRRDMRGTFRQIWLKLMQETGLEMGEEWQPVPGYVPRKVRRRMNGQIVEEEPDTVSNEEEEEGEDAAAYRRLVERDQAEDLF